MATRKKIVVRLILIVAIAFAVLLLLAPVFLNIDRYRPRIVSYFEEATGKKVEIERLALTLVPQPTIHITGFGVKSPPLFPPSYVLKVPQADATVDLQALLHGKVMITSLVMDGPEINLISDPDGPWNFENPESKTSKNLFPLGIINKVVIHRGQLIVSNLLPSDAPGPVFLEAHDITSELDSVNLAAIVNPASRSLDGYGSWKAARLRLGAVEVTNAKCNFRLESREVLFTDLMADAYTGKTTGFFSVSLLKKVPSFKADAQIKGINITRLLADFHEMRGRLSGNLDGNLKLAGEIEHTTNPLSRMRGIGHVKLTNGDVPNLKLNANLMKLARFNDLGPAKENPSSFASISADLELESLHIISKVIDVDGYGVDVDGSGSVSISGSDELNYQGVATITTKQGLLTNMFARLEGAKLNDGKLSFPFRIEGSIENPKFLKGTKEK
jgi:uncharacterized protein involved in outer membrane biogenesis